MIDEIKQLGEMVNQLPHLALWVIAAFWAYKVILIGSIFSLIKYIVSRVVDLILRMRKVGEVDNQISVLDDYCLNDTSASAIKAVLKECQHDDMRVVRYPADRYFSKAHLTWLKKAIDEKLERDGLKDKK